MPVTQKTTTYPVQPANGGSIPDREEVSTDSDAGESSRHFAARHLDDLEGRMRAKPLWLGSHEALSKPVMHSAVVAGEEHVIEVAHKKGELADAWASRAVHAIARWSLSNPADV